MDNLKETIMQNGVEFSNAFTTTPICCPSRSSILTGKINIYMLLDLLSME